VRAYVNDCPHLGVPLDSRGGDFFEEDRRYLVCTFHGALFAPETGECVAGPCKGDALTGLACRERGGQIQVFDVDPSQLTGADGGEVGQSDLLS
jgi:nitrite reductase/ring-hydroxylating ferredoxin subunit